MSKIINCDVCKREIGRQVDVGNFIGWGSGTKYNPPSFGISVESKRITDICSECFIKIAEAQEKAINEIRGNYKQ